jgi:hypothetical protein
MLVGAALNGATIPIVTPLTTECCSNYLGFFSCEPNALLSRR